MISRAQTWLCVLLCRWAERAHCKVTGHPVVHVKPGVRWCGRCGVPV